MQMLLWIGLFVYLQFQLGFGWGLLITCVLWFIMQMIIEYRNMAAVAKGNELRENNVLLTLEAVENQGQIIYLAYSLPTNKFVVQSTSITEFMDELIKKFEGKNIWVSKGTTGIEPLAEAVKQLRVN